MDFSWQLRGALEPRMVECWWVEWHFVAIATFDIGHSWKETYESVYAWLKENAQSKRISNDHWIRNYETPIVGKGQKTTLCRRIASLFHYIRAKVKKNNILNLWRKKKKGEREKSRREKRQIRVWAGRWKLRWVLRSKDH